MKEFIKQILSEELEGSSEEELEIFFEKSPLLRYLDLKTGAIYGNSKTRRSLGNVYSIYAILEYYTEEFYNKPEEYKKFEGYEYTKLFNFYRGLYGGSKLQNHGLNSRVNGEFKNKIVSDTDNDLIFINNGKYGLHIEYLYVDGIDIGKIAKRIIEEYISLLMLKDNKLINDIEALIKMDTLGEKKRKISEFLEEDAEARIFEIISYSILKNHYKGIELYIGYSLDDLKKEYLTLYKTGRTNANDGGIDFVMRPLGRFFQVTEVENYDKYLLDIDKVLHFPITFIIKTNSPKEKVMEDIHDYIELKSKGMKVIKEKYIAAFEEIITINELKQWLMELDNETMNDLLRDIDLYYKLELNLLGNVFDDEE